MRNTVITSLALILTATPTLAGLTRPSGQVLIIRSYDNYGLTSAELEAAKADVRQIFSRARIGIRWVDRIDASSGRCAQPPGINELIIRFVRASATPDREPFAMGSALVEEHATANGLLTIYPDLVDRLADGAVGLRVRARVSGTRNRPLLGSVIAHEIGHLLLGPTHSAHGLMRAVWTHNDVMRDFPFDWIFSKGEAKRMREILSTANCRPTIDEDRRETTRLPEAVIDGRLNPAQPVFRQDLED